MALKHCLVFLLVLCFYVAETWEFELEPVLPVGLFALIEPRLPDIKVIEGVVDPDSLRTCGDNSEQSQPYCSYEIIGEQARASLRRILNFNTPTPFQRSFAAIMLAIHKTGEEVAKGVDYDTAYDSAVALVTTGDLVPQYARDYNLDFLAEIDDKVNPIKAWVHTILIGSGRVINRGDLKSCDRQVSSLVLTHPSYQKSAKLVVEVGEISRLFNSRAKEIENVAKAQTEKQYIANGRNDLKPLVIQTAAVFKVLRNY